MIHFLILILSFQICLILPLDIIKIIGYIFSFILFNSLLYFILDANNEDQDDKDQENGRHK